MCVSMSGKRDVISPRPRERVSPRRSPFDKVSYDSRYTLFGVVFAVMSMATDIGTPARSINPSVREKFA